MKKKKKKYHDGASGSEYEYEYDESGRLIGKVKVKEGLKAKKHVTRDKFDNDDGNYFEKVSSVTARQGLNVTKCVAG